MKTAAYILLAAVICLFRGEMSRREEVAEDLSNLKMTSVACHNKLKDVRMDIKDLEDRLNKKVLEEYIAED